MVWQSEKNSPWTAFGLIALILQTPLQDALSKPLLAASFLMVNGCILLYAERYRRRADVHALAEREGLNRKGSRRLSTLEYREAAVIGVGESAALIAGISRDGMCMTAGLARGLDNADAARFAFLLATPPILLAGLCKFSDLIGPQGDGIRGPAILAAVIAAVVSVFTVRFLTGYFKTQTLRPFGVYCLGFGTFMIVFTLVFSALGRAAPAAPEPWRVAAARPQQLAKVRASHHVPTV